MVLYLSLGSVRASLLILTNIPFAMVGGMVALAISGEYLSVPASVGFIALVGIAVFWLGFKRTRPFLHPFTDQ